MERPAVIDGVQAARRQRGQAAFLTGASAEDQVARHYERAGARCLDRRWRCDAGEVDLVFEDGETVIFVEVKRAARMDWAAGRLSPRQAARIGRAAEAYVADRPRGGMTDIRIDLAMVDGTGRIEIVENALA